MRDQKHATLFGICARCRICHGAAEKANGVNRHQTRTAFQTRPSLPPPNYIRWKPAPAPAIKTTGFTILRSGRRCPGIAMRRGSRYADGDREPRAARGITRCYAIAPTLLSPYHELRFDCCAALRSSPPPTRSGRLSVCRCCVYVRTYVSSHPHSARHPAA